MLSTGGPLSQADLTMEGHAAGLTTGIPPFSIPAKKIAIWLFIIADTATCCMPGSLWVRPQCHSQLAETLP